VKVETTSHHGWSLLQRRNGDVEVWGPEGRIVDVFPGTARRLVWLPRWFPWNVVRDDDRAWRLGVACMRNHAELTRRLKTPVPRDNP